MISPEPEKVTLEKQLGDRTGPLVLAWSEYPVIPGPAGRLLQHRARVRLESARQLLPDARRQRALAEKAGGFAPYELQWTVAAHVFKFAFCKFLQNIYDSCVIFRPKIPWKSTKST